MAFYSTAMSLARFEGAQTVPKTLSKMVYPRAETARGRVAEQERQRTSLAIEGQERHAFWAAVTPGDDPN